MPLTTNTRSAAARRYATPTFDKAEGATYTPRRLADFVAKQMLVAATLPAKGAIRLLDPSCGDGALIASLLAQFDATTLRRVEVVGFDTDASAVKAARKRIGEEFPNVASRIEEQNFLLHLAQRDCADLFERSSDKSLFNLIIANPPYVRTQVLGADVAQRLAAQFGLAGRVDLCFPFFLGLSDVLAQDGTMGIIVSNRFMTTKAGETVRSELPRRYRLRHIWDFGDTKLFDAAVLPAVIVAQGRGTAIGPVAFSSIYEASDAARSRAADPVDAVAAPNGAVVEISDGRAFRVTHGELRFGQSEGDVWRMSTDSHDAWLATVESNTWDTFKRIGAIRVGVKTTADKVFISDDWHKMSEEERPELLRPLITKSCKRQYRAIAPEKPKQILYTHCVTRNRREAVDLTKFPRSKRYLEMHRRELEARDYVIKAGRQWFEIWVPQNPDAWSDPKIVFVDIADRPTFWLDADGGIVNGECYWLRCENGAPMEWLWLALAVANSPFIEVFYDHRFHNKLYSGRRRFMTQYVEQFPLPDPESKIAKRIIALVQRVYVSTPSSEADALAAELNALVFQAFGLPPEEPAR